MLERIQAPAGGLNTTSAPDYVPPTQAPALQNLLTSRPGQAVLRGPLNFLAGVDVTMTDRSVFWVYDDKVLVGDTVASLVQYFDGITVSATTIAAGPPPVPNSKSFARVGSLVFGSVLSGGNSVTGKWDPAANTVTAYANGPKGTGMSFAAHLQRVFVLLPKGATLPGGATATGTTLVWSDALGPTADTTAMWQDDVSGLVNQIVVDTSSDTPVGIVESGQSLVILLGRSIYLLSGTGSSSFAVRRISTEHGVIGGLQTSTDGCYFMTDRGYCYFDGASISIVSEAINATLVPAARNGCVAAAFPTGHIAVCVPLTGLWLYHPPTASWTQITSRWWTVPTAVGRTLNYPFIFDMTGARVWSAKDITASNWSESGHYGFDWPQIGGAEKPKSVDALWTTHAAKLSSPDVVSSVMRALLDAVFSAQTVGSSGLPDGWTLTVKDLSGNVLVSATLPALTPASQLRSRDALDCFGETDAVQLVIEWAWQPSGGAVSFPRIDRAAIYDAWVEFQPGQVRGTT